MRPAGVIVTLQVVLIRLAGDVPTKQRHGYAWAMRFERAWTELCSYDSSRIMREVNRLPYLVTAFLVLVSCATLLWMGRVPWCACGHIDLWGSVGTSEGSQQLFDWYTPSHLLHGFVFYAALWLFARRLALGGRLVIATLIECAWEIAENTDTVIQRSA